MNGGEGGSLVGVTLQGRYHLVRLLGHGGMGSVYKAADAILRRFVAVKVLHPETTRNKSAVDRFVREARAAAAIGHPNIVDVLDFGHDSGRPFFVMEYLRGRPLSQAIADEAPLSFERACRIATHTLAALAAAHERGILHRDIKPANLLLTAHLGDRDFVKLCDFGFAGLKEPRKRLDDGRSLTPERVLVGTPQYAAPERLRGDPGRDPRADLYAVGVVLFEMLAGTRPFDGKSFPAVALAIRDSPAPRLRTLRPAIPEGLDAVVDKALAKNPDERWQTAAAFAEALVPFGGKQIPTNDDDPSDSFTMGLLQIRARDTRRFRTEKGAAETPRSPTPRRREPTPDVEAEPSDLDGQETERGRLPAVFDPLVSVRGDLVVAVLRGVAHAHGERALRNVLDALPPTVAPIFAGGVGPGDWVPYAAYAALLGHVDAQHGKGDLRLVVSGGEAAAAALFRQVDALGTKPPPPELVITELPRIFGDAIRGVRLVVSQVGRGYGRIRVHEHAEPSLLGCVAAIGTIDACLRHVGAKDPEVTLLRCQGLGDPGCEIDVSWLAS